MKQAWLDRVAKELKDRQLADFYWPVEPGLVADPFAHRDDFAGGKPGAAAAFSKEKNGWEICEAVPADDAQKANRLAQNALEGGAEGIEFVFEKGDRPDFDTLLDGLFLEMMGLHFSEKKGSRQTIEGIWEVLPEVLSDRRTDGEELRGSLRFSGNVPPGAIDFSVETAGRFRTAGFETDPKLPPTGQLEDLLKQAISFLKKKEREGIPPEKAAMAVHFELPVGPDFLTEVAKFRAFQGLWPNVQKAWGFEKIEPPVVHAVFSPAATIEGDEGGNFIRAAPMAMAAVIGGCDRLTVAPAGGTGEFHRRIARNVQHLLKLESGFERVQDPGAGSYFLEKLSRQMAEAVWAKL